MEKTTTHIVKITEMTIRQKIAYGAIFSTGITLTIAFAAWWLRMSHIPANFHGAFHVFDLLLFLVLSYVVWHQIINECFFWILAWWMKRPVPLEPEPEKRVAFLTAFVPGKEPYDILEKTLRAMVEAEYQHDTWLLDEGDDTIAKEICLRYGVKHYTRKGIAKYNASSGPFRAKTKAGNYNSWFDQHAHGYDFVGQLDVDFAPKKDFLMKTLGYFRDAEVAFVGTPQIYGNTHISWIARGAAEQAYGFYGSMQKGLFGRDMQLFIGANHVVRVSAHDDIEHYSGHIVEDHLTGMKFYSKQWKSVYVPEILAIGEGPATWDAYFGQQMRWAYGLIHILFTESPRLFRKMRKEHAAKYFLLQQYYFYGLAQVLGIFLLTLYFFFGIQSTVMPLTELVIFYGSVFIMQQVIFLWLQRFNIDPKNEHGLMLKGKLLNMAAWPIYFIAFFGVIIGKRLTYIVTPKGNQQITERMPSLFLPHFILGTITFVGIAVGRFTGHSAPQLLFWATLNTIVMYFFFFTEVAPFTSAYIKKYIFALRRRTAVSMPESGVGVSLPRLEERSTITVDEETIL